MFPYVLDILVSPAIVPVVYLNNQSGSRWSALPTEGLTHEVQHQQKSRHALGLTHPGPFWRHEHSQNLMLRRWTSIGIGNLLMEPLCLSHDERVKGPHRRPHSLFLGVRNPHKPWLPAQVYCLSGMVNATCHQSSKPTNSSSQLPLIVNMMDMSQKVQPSCT